MMDDSLRRGRSGPRAVAANTSTGQCQMYQA